MQKELEGLRASEKLLRAKLRDMELDNDDLEKNERCVVVSRALPVGTHAGLMQFASLQSHLLFAGGCRGSLQ